MASVDELCKDLEDKMDMLRARQSRRDQFLAKTTGDSETESPQGNGEALPALINQSPSTSPQRGAGGGDNNEAGHGGQDVYLGNLPKGTTQEELMGQFARFRPIRARALINNGDDWSYGFVRLPSMDEAKRAVQAFNGMETNGHQLTVRICRDRSRARIMEEGVTRGMNVPDPNYAAMTVHIANLGVQVTEEDIMKLFTDYGGISQITLFSTFDRKRKYSRVTLRSEALVEKAITDLRGTTLYENVIYVNRFGANRPTHNGGSRHHGSRHTGHQNRGNVANARRLIQKIEVLSSEVLDSCEFCRRLQCLIKELQGVLHEM